MAGRSREILAGVMFGNPISPGDRTAPLGSLKIRRGKERSRVMERRILNSCEKLEEQTLLLGSPAGTPKPTEKPEKQESGGLAPQCGPRLTADYGG